MPEDSILPFNPLDTHSSSTRGSAFSHSDLTQTRLRSRSSFATEHFHTPSSSPPDVCPVLLASEENDLVRHESGDNARTGQARLLSFPAARKAESPIERRRIREVAGVTHTTATRPRERGHGHDRRFDDETRLRFHSFDESADRRDRDRQPSTKLSGDCSFAEAAAAAAFNDDDGQTLYESLTTTPYASPIPTPRSSPSNDGPCQASRCQGANCLAAPSHGASPDTLEAATTDTKTQAENVQSRLRNQKRRMAVLAVATFLFACAGEFSNPVLTQYIYQIYTDSVYGNDSIGVHISSNPCPEKNRSNNASTNATDSRETQVQDQSADLLMRLELVSGAIAIGANLLLGSYSDVLGRRFTLLLPLTGHFLRNLTVPVIIYWNLGLPALYAGYVLDGACGGSSGEESYSFSWTEWVSVHLLCPRFCDGYFR